MIGAPVRAESTNMTEMMKGDGIQDVADAHILAEDNLRIFALAALLAGNHAHKGRFAGAVFGNQTDLLPLVDVKTNIAKEQFFAVGFGDVF